MRSIIAKLFLLATVYRNIVQGSEEGPKPQTEKTFSIYFVNPSSEFPRFQPFPAFNSMKVGRLADNIRFVDPPPKDMDYQLVFKGEPLCETGTMGSYGVKEQDVVQYIPVWKDMIRITAVDQTGASHVVVVAERMTIEQFKAAVLIQTIPKSEQECVRDTCRKWGIKVDMHEGFDGTVADTGIHAGDQIRIMLKGPFTVNVRNIVGKVFPVETWDGMKIKTLVKRVMAAMFPDDDKEMKLWYKRQILEEEGTVGQYEIKDGASLHAIVRDADVALHAQVMHGLLNPPACVVPFAH